MTAQRSDQQLTEARTALEADEYGTGAPHDPHGVADEASGAYWRVIDPQVRTALLVALATGRPLLVRGDPGTGKSSLAKAVAKTLGWRYLSMVVTSQTQLEDFLWSVDHLSRLRDAQVRDEQVSARAADESNYLRRGVLWDAFAPRDDDPRPAVVLIDEIDKADPEVPNNLLVPLGALAFTVTLTDDQVEVGSDKVPLVIITSNAERDLSPAFLRRCVKLTLTAPGFDQLEAIARGHLGEDADPVIGRTRQAFEAAALPRTPALFIDAARAANRLGHDDSDEFWAELGELLAPTAD